MVVPSVIANSTVTPTMTAMGVVEVNSATTADARSSLAAPMISGPRTRLRAEIGCDTIAATIPMGSSTSPAA